MVRLNELIVLEKMQQKYWFVLSVCTLLLSCAYAQPTSAEVEEYFPNSYQQAREHFLEAAEAAGASIESFRNPREGPNGAFLFTDVAVIGPKDSESILVLNSGTHGVEGFAGSGIQTGLLRERLAKRLNKDTSLVLIHALNPYGFSHLRRFNEDNVDLNRNFIDHAIGKYPDNNGYRELAELIGPASISVWQNIRARLGFLSYRLRDGKPELQQAISGGQYSHPDGLFYGGKSETWSNKTFRKIASNYLAHAKHVVFIDFHTGLGPYGAAEVIISEKGDSPALQRSTDWWGDRVKNTVTGDSVSTHVQGPIKTSLVQMLPEAEVTAVSLEFGTYPAPDVFWALRDENWLHHHGGDKHLKTAEIKAELLRVFYPDTDDWKSLIWDEGKKIVEQAVNNL